jgi:hypothetical protein
MGRVVNRLAAMGFIPTTVGTLGANSLYDNPAATKTYVKTIIIFNSNTTAETVALYNVPANGTSKQAAIVPNHQFYEMVLNPKQTVMLEIAGQGLILETQNDSIQAITTTGNKVTFQAYGIKET